MLMLGADMLNALICLLIVTASLCLSACAEGVAESMTPFKKYNLDFDTPPDPALQSSLETIDLNLRTKYGMTTEQTAVGILDLKQLRLAMIHPDRIEYAASVAKVGILLAYFQLHPDAAHQSRVPKSATNSA